MRATAAILAMLTLSTLPLRAEETDPKADFVADNLVSVFYHELGHALIDQLELPVLGREEDAADILSVLLIDEVWEPDVAEQIVANNALAYAMRAAEGAEGDPAFWDVHGHDLQRYFTHVCLFYGADPEGREQFAIDADLPEERASGCAEERDLAEQSWWAFLEPLSEQAPGTALALNAAEDDFTAEIIGAEVEALNERFDLPREVRVDVTECGEINAFYIPDESRIMMCTEFTKFLWEQAEAAEL